jgi:hypothetical protein
MRAWTTSGRKLAFTGLIGFAVMFSSLAVPVLSKAAPLAASHAETAGNCGSYQCFYYASDFLSSEPDPQPGQVATVPLAQRVIGPAPGGPSMLVGLDNGPRAFWEVSDGFTQGRSGLVNGVPTGNVYNFGHWQYVDALYYYLHDTVSVPPTQWVNAAHRNGVPVLGTVTGDCDPCESEAPKLFTLRNYRTTVRLLYQYAVAYGFDGWVIDMELGFQPAPGVLAAVKELAGLRLPDGQPLRVAVYRASESALEPTSLLPYFAAGADWQADYAPDAPPPSYPMQTYQNLRAAGLAARHLDAYWSSDVYSPSYKTSCPRGERLTSTQLWNGNPGTAPECVNSQKLFDNQRIIRSGPTAPPGTPTYYTSTGLFAPEWTYFGNLPDPPSGDVAVGPASRSLVHAADDALWVGTKARYSGPSCARSGPANAVSALVTPRSVIGALPFVTNFNQGEGDLYAIDGKLAAPEQWNSLSAQDVLPTWTCTVHGDLSANPVYATAANGDADNGGSALMLTGRGPGEVALYGTRIKVPAGAAPTLAFTSKSVTGALPYLKVTYSDGTTQLIQRVVAGPGWQQTTGPLSAAGKTITRISVGFSGGTGSTRTVLGQLRIYDAKANAAPPLIAVTSIHAVISWNQPRTPAISYWNVYAGTARCVRFLGPAFTTTFSVRQAMFTPPVRPARFVIQPVSASGAMTKVGSAC